MRHSVINGQVLQRIVFKTQNIIIQEISKGTRNKRCLIVGNGDWLEIDKDRIISKHSRGMSEPDFKLNKDYTAYVFYFTFECSGLSQAAKEVASFVDHISSEYTEIVLVGHGKCGLCFAEATNYTHKQVTLVTVSTPFGGTILADRNAVKQTLKSHILFMAYNSIFNEHHLNSEILPDADYLKNICIKNVHTHINVICILRLKQECHGIRDLLCLKIGTKLGIDGDGIISYFSQDEVLSDETLVIFHSYDSSLKTVVDSIDRILN